MSFVLIAVVAHLAVTHANVVAAIAVAQKDHPILFMSRQTPNFATKCREEP